MKPVECWRIIWHLPARHPIKLQLDAALHGPCMPIHFRIQLKQRCLKWAYKQITNMRMTFAEAITEGRQMHWNIIRKEIKFTTLKSTGKLISRHYLNQLRFLPRDCKPLPLP